MIKYIIIILVLSSCGSSNDPTDTYYLDDWKFTRNVWTNKVFYDNGDTLLIDKNITTYIKKNITNSQAEDSSWNFSYMQSQSKDFTYYIQINFLTNKIKL